MIAKRGNWRHKGKAVLVQVCTGPEGSRRLRLPGKIVSPIHRPPLTPPPGNIPGTLFCQRLGRLQDHGAAGRIVSMKNVDDAI